MRCSSCARLSAVAATFGGLAAAYVLVVRPRLLYWGASADDACRALPGDELVPHPRLGTTRAVTIAAPAEPSANCAASDAGLLATASAPAGITNWIAAFISM